MDPENTTIIPNKLYLGSLEQVEKEILSGASEPLTTIISVLGKSHKLYFQRIWNNAVEKGLTWFNKLFDAEDDPDFPISKYFRDSTQTIDNELKRNHRVWVHCHMGISRSATIVIAYIIRYYVMTWRESIDYLISIRSVICPNQGFILQLHKWENSIRPERHCYIWNILINELKLISSVGRIIEEYANL